MQDQRTLPDNTCRALFINIQLPYALLQINIVPEVQATGNIPNQPIRFVLISSLDYQIAGSLSCNVWQSTKAARLIETNLHVPQCLSPVSSIKDYYYLSCSTTFKSVEGPSVCILLSSQPTPPVHIHSSLLVNKRNLESKIIIFN
jgi:hypothetical protein